MVTPNCWEFKRCGREPGGAKAEELGVCPASVNPRLDGVNHGESGGRTCWAIAGTLCGGKVQGTFASKLGNCMECEFFKQVLNEEGSEFKNVKDFMDKLR